MKRLLIALMLAGAAVAALTAMLLPPPALSAVGRDATPAWPVARGAYHVHSRRSDGTGTFDEIAAAAARAGLQFVIVTDHGDGTRAPEPPAYRSGVLVIDGVEISTEHGHYVALDLPQTPYPLRGHPREVIEDVERFGGFGFVAHPGSPKAALRWEDWEAPFDGLEWLNADSEWRDEFWGSLGGVLLTYTLRPVETLVGLLDRPDAVLRQWDRLATTRRVPALAGADAHARLGYRAAADPYDDYVIARVPGYEVSFRAFVNHVVLDSPFTGEAAADGRLLLDGIRSGRTFTSIDGAAGLNAFELHATSGTSVARPGEYLDIVGPVTIVARVAAPPGTRLSVLRDGTSVYETQEPVLRIDVGTTPGAYRVEAHLADGRSRSSVPWILTNPMYVGLREVHARAGDKGSSRPAVTVRAPIATEAWQAEASGGSVSSLRPDRLEDGTPAIEWSFALRGSGRDSQYAAVRFPADGALGEYDRLVLRARSDRPRRVWAQVRVPGDRGGERWGHSFYVDATLRSIELPFDAFRPLGSVSSDRPPLARVNSILLVMDTDNAAPGSSGRVAITDLWLAR